MNQFQTLEYFIIVKSITLAPQTKRLTKQKRLQNTKNNL